jgi:predicted RNA-binding protein (virulence factor B family)
MFEVPTIAVPVEVSLTNGEEIPGTIYITADLMTAAGNLAVEDLLNNKRENFVSFQSDAGGFRLLNKQHIVFIETNQTDEEARSQTPHEPRSLILHFVSDYTLFGMIYPTQREQLRVSDLLNSPRQFLVLYRQGHKFIFNRELIIYANAN